MVEVKKKVREDGEPRLKKNRRLGRVGGTERERRICDSLLCH
jgi:hypothetical protein